MRQVFTSPRLTNVEAVAALLEEAGIATKITNGPSYRGKFDRGMSYRDTGGDNQAAVWVMRSEDQPRAREMLEAARRSWVDRPECLAAERPSGQAVAAQSPFVVREDAG